MRTTLLAMLLLLVPSIALADPVCGNVTSTITGTGATPVTVAYTTPAGSNQVLIVIVPYRDVSDSVSSATHAGNAMQIKIQKRHSSQVSGVALLYIVAPTSGTNNVVVNFTGTPLAHGVIIFTCSDASQDADPFRDAGNSAEGSGTAPTVTITDSATDLTIDGMAVDSNTTAPTKGADQTEVYAGSDGVELGAGVSTQPGSGDGVMSWTVSSNDWVMVGAALKAAATASRRPISPLVFQ